MGRSSKSNKGSRGKSPKKSTRKSTKKSDSIFSGVERKSVSSRSMGVKKSDAQKMLKSVKVSAAEIRSLDDESMVNIAMLLDIQEAESMGKAELTSMLLENANALAELKKELYGVLIQSGKNPSGYSLGEIVQLAQEMSSDLESESESESDSEEVSKMVRSLKKDGVPGAESIRSAKDLKQFIVGAARGKAATIEEAKLLAKIADRIPEDSAENRKLKAKAKEMANEVVEMQHETGKVDAVATFTLEEAKELLMSKGVCDASDFSDLSKWETTLDSRNRVNRIRKIGSMDKFMSVEDYKSMCGVGDQATPVGEFLSMLQEDADKNSSQDEICMNYTRWLVDQDGTFKYTDPSGVQKTFNSLSDVEQAISSKCSHADSEELKKVLQRILNGEEMGYIEATRRASAQTSEWSKVKSALTIDAIRKSFSSATDTTLNTSIGLIVSAGIMGLVGMKYGPSLNTIVNAPIVDELKKKMLDLSLVKKFQSMAASTKDCIEVYKGIITGNRQDVEQTEVVQKGIKNGQITQSDLDGIKSFNPKAIIKDAFMRLITSMPYFGERIIRAEKEIESKNIDTETPTSESISEVKDVVSDANPELVEKTLDKIVEATSGPEIDRTKNIPSDGVTLNDLVSRDSNIKNEVDVLNKYIAKPLGEHFESNSKGMFGDFDLKTSIYVIGTLVGLGVLKQTGILENMFPNISGDSGLLSSAKSAIQKLSSNIKDKVTGAFTSPGELLKMIPAAAKWISGVPSAVATKGVSALAGLGTLGNLIPVSSKLVDSEQAHVAVAKVTKDKNARKLVEIMEESMELLSLTREELARESSYIFKSSAEEMTLDVFKHIVLNYIDLVDYSKAYKSADYKAAKAWLKENSSTRTAPFKGKDEAGVKDSIRSSEALVSLIKEVNQEKGVLLNDTEINDIRDKMLKDVLGNTKINLTSITDFLDRKEIKRSDIEKLSSVNAIIDYLYETQITSCKISEVNDENFNLVKADAEALINKKIREFKKDNMDEELDLYEIALAKKNKDDILESGNKVTQEMIAVAATIDSEMYANFAKAKEGLYIGTLAMQSYRGEPLIKDTVSFTKDQEVYEAEQERLRKKYKLYLCSRIEDLAGFKMDTNQKNQYRLKRLQEILEIILKFYIINSIPEPGFTEDATKVRKQKITSEMKQFLKGDKNVIKALCKKYETKKNEGEIKDIKDNIYNKLRDEAHKFVEIKKAAVFVSEISESKYGFAGKPEEMYEAYEINTLNEYFGSGNGTKLENILSNFTKKLDSFFANFDSKDSGKKALGDYLITVNTISLLNYEMRYNLLAEIPLYEEDGADQKIKIIEVLQAIMAIIIQYGEKSGKIRDNMNTDKTFGDFSNYYDRLLERIAGIKGTAEEEALTDLQDITVPNFYKDFTEFVKFYKEKALPYLKSADPDYGGDLNEKHRKSLNRFNLILQDRKTTYDINIQALKKYDKITIPNFQMFLHTVFKALAFYCKSTKFGELCTDRINEYIVKIVNNVVLYFNAVDHDVSVNAINKYLNDTDSHTRPIGEYVYKLSVISKDSGFNVLNSPTPYLFATETTNGNPFTNNSREPVLATKKPVSKYGEVGGTKLSPTYTLAQDQTDLLKFWVITQLCKFNIDIYSIVRIYNDVALTIIDPDLNYKARVYIWIYTLRFVKSDSEGNLSFIANIKPSEIDRAKEFEDRFGSSNTEVHKKYETGYGKTNYDAMEKDFKGDLTGVTLTLADFLKAIKSFLFVEVEKKETQLDNEKAIIDMFVDKPAVGANIFTLLIRKTETKQSLQGIGNTTFKKFVANGQKFLVRKNEAGYYNGSGGAVEPISGAPQAQKDDVKFIENFPEFSTKLTQAYINALANKSDSMISSNVNYLPNKANVKNEWPIKSLLPEDSYFNPPKDVDTDEIESLYSKARSQYDEKAKSIVKEKKDNIVMASLKSWADSITSGVKSIYSGRTVTPLSQNLYATTATLKKLETELNTLEKTVTEAYNTYDGAKKAYTAITNPTEDAKKTYNLAINEYTPVYNQYITKLEEYNKQAARLRKINNSANPADKVSTLTKPDEIVTVTTSATLYDMPSQRYNRSYVRRY